MKKPPSPIIAGGSARRLALAAVPAIFLALASAVHGFDPVPANPRFEGKLAPYPSPAERVAEVEALRASHPGLVEVGEYGRSVGGEPLQYIRISSVKEPGRPAAWFGACIHGNEWIGNRMVMAIARKLLEDRDTDPLIRRAMDEMDFYIAPCINPDGYKKTWDSPHSEEAISNMGVTVAAGDEDSSWAHCRKNANGVDLNRNWPLPGNVLVLIDWAGSPDPASVHYRGPSPLSEPETRELDRFFREREEIVAAISFHSTGGVFFPAHCPSRRCMKLHKSMLKSFRAEQGMLKYPRLQSRVFDTYTGEMEDWLYAEHGVVSADVEISRTGMNREECGCEDLFWSFNPRDPGRWIGNDARGAIAAVLEASRLVGGNRIPPGER